MTMQPIDKNAHLLINHLAVAKDRLRQASTAGLPPVDQIGLMVASMSNALIDIAQTLRDIRDLQRLDSNGS